MSGDGTTKLPLPVLRKSRRRSRRRSSAWGSGHDEATLPKALDQSGNSAECLAIIGVNGVRVSPKGARAGLFGRHGDQSILLAGRGVEEEERGGGVGAVYAVSRQPQAYTNLRFADSPPTHRERGSHDVSSGQRSAVNGELFRLERKQQETARTVQRDLREKSSWRAGIIGSSRRKTRRDHSQRDDG